MEVLNMFNTNDRDLIMKIINSRDTKTETMIPVYLCIGNKKYSLLEVDKILSCSPSIFKIGFGTSLNVFIHNKFPKQELINMNGCSSFVNMDEDTQVATEYILFESSDFPEDTDNRIYNEINKWYFILLDYVMEAVDKTRKAIIKQSMEEIF